MRQISRFAKYLTYFGLVIGDNLVLMNGSLPQEQIQTRHPPFGQSKTLPAAFRLEAQLRNMPSGPLHP
jgi:hypothetical protein